MSEGCATAQGAVHSVEGVWSKGEERGEREGSKEREGGMGNVDEMDMEQQCRGESVSGNWCCVYGPFPCFSAHDRKSINHMKQRRPN